MEKDYKFLEHKADAKFRAFGKTLNQQFQNSAKALTKVITDDKIKPKIKKIIRVKGIDKKNLLLNFLEELLFLIDTKNFILAKAKVKIQSIKHLQSNSHQLTAELTGDSINNYRTKTHIKAVTYNQMQITKNFVQVILDI